MRTSSLREEMGTAVDIVALWPSPRKGTRPRAFLECGGSTPLWILQFLDTAQRPRGIHASTNPNRCPPPALQKRNAITYHCTRWHRALHFTFLTMSVAPR